MIVSFYCGRIYSISNMFSVQMTNIGIFYDCTYDKKWYLEIFFSYCLLSTHEIIVLQRLFTV